MASRTRQAVLALQAALQDIDGDAPFTFDLSGDDRVKIGQPTDAEGRYPCCWVSRPEMASGHGPQLGDYRRELTIDFEARVSSSSDNATTRLLDAADLANDIHVALEADRTLDGVCLDLIVVTNSLDGDELGLPGLAVVEGAVLVYWHARSGAGV